MMRSSRLKAACLALACLLLAGCSAAPAPAEEPVSTESPVQSLAETPTPEPVLPESAPESTPEPEPEEPISLSAVELSFEHKGEKAEIYNGEAELSRVNWSTDDPEVAMVSEGKVMSVGPGETTIRAAYGSQELACRVTCTAPEDEYAVLDEDIVHAPLLNPPYLTEEEDALARSFYADAAFLGDSVSYVFCQWETKMDWMGDVTFLTRGGISLESAVTGRWKIYYQGTAMSYADALSACGAKKAFIMMGANDLAQFGIDGTMDYYKTFVERIVEKNPDVEIYIQSVTPVWTPAEWPAFNNAMIDEFDVLLRAYAEETGYHYVDVAPYFKDYTNGLAKRYASDMLMHFNGDGCYVWAQVLKAYALEQLSEEGVS